MDDLDAEALKLMREAIERRRGYADFYAWPPDRDIEELGVVEDLCEALANAGAPLATSITSRGRGHDPPDCEGIDPHGRSLAIEVTELVDPDAIKAAKEGNRYRWAEWTPEKLRDSIQARLSKKDACVLKGGPYSNYVVAIHTDEPELTTERLRALLRDTTFKVSRINRAFLLLSYDPKIQAPPFLELPLSDP